jgi:hypothetical protein
MTVFNIGELNGAGLTKPVQMLGHHHNNTGKTGALWLCQRGEERLQLITYPTPYYTITIPNSGLGRHILSQGIY